MDVYCMGCGGMKNEHAACPTPRKPGCVMGFAVPVTPEPPKAKKAKKKGRR